MLNKIVIQGRLTRDPELRHTQTCKSVANFTVACDRDGTKGDDKVTDFIDCVAWEKTGEFVSNYFSKGRQILLSGSLQIRSYNDKEGVARRTAEIVCRDVYFCDSKKDAAQSHSEPVSTYSAPSVGVPADDYQLLTGDDEQLPF